MAKKKGNTNQETGNTVNMFVPNEGIVTVGPDGTRTVNTGGLNTVTELPSDYTEIVGKGRKNPIVTYPDMNSGLGVELPKGGDTEGSAGGGTGGANKANPTPKRTVVQTSNNDNGMLGHFDENGNYVDPYGVVFYDGFTGKNLNNADTEKSAYGDDSTLATYNTGNNKGGTNDKYTGENTRNTYTWYNANIKTSDLDPNYQYGGLAQQQESLQNSYIANRNDNIASALYNEGKTSIEDVANFLNQQAGFQNSTPEQRENTINSVWKRIGQIKADEEDKEEPKEETDLSKAEDIVQDTSGKIYGKTTAEEGDPKQGIDTLADANSVFRAMEEARVKNLQEFVSLNPEDVAVAKNSGYSTWSEQTWRDAEKYYPDFIAAVNEEVKRQRTQQNVNAIASGEEMDTVADNVDTDTQLTSYAVNNATSTTSATQLLKGIDSILESNNTAKSAQDLMGSIEKDMATLKNRLMNLKNEANAAFKGDAPQYLVSAYMNNKSQEIQNQLSILEDRYNAAYNRYKLEVSNAQWQAEFDLKKDSFALEKWKAENGGTTTSSTSSQSKMRTERNNNPTAMTTDYAKMMGLELGVDYEIGDSFIGGDGRTYYTAKFIGDPIEMSIKAFDRGAANNVFANEGGVLGHWHLGISNQQWLNMTDGEKREVINKILKKEGGNMNNMAYYTELGGNNSSGYDLTYQSAYEKYLSGNYNKAWIESQCKTMGISESQFGQQAQAYKKARDAGELDIEDSVLMNGGKRVRNDGNVFDFSKSNLYKGLSERDKEAVQQLLNNTISKKYINNNRTAYDNPSGIFSAVNQIDPTWNEALFSRREAAEKKREQGKQGGWVSRNESAMATAKELYSLADVLDDKTIKVLGEQYNVKTLKDLANLAKTELGDTRISYLATLVYGLEEEAAGALKGGNAANSDKDIENMERLLDIGMSQSQLKAATKGIARLLYLKDESEVRDLAALTYIKPDSTWSQSVTDWMYNTLGMKDIPLYYNYTPSGTTKMTQEEEDALYNLD